MAGTSKAKAGKTGVKKTPVRVWSECGVVVQIADFNNVRFAFGHERISPSDSPEDIDRTEAEIYKHCEKVVEKRVRKLSRLANAVREEYSD